MFSKKKKELIRKMKDELRFMGVPRQQWSIYIQKELRERHKSKDIRTSKFMNKITDGFGTAVGKVASKKNGDFDSQLEEFEDLLCQQNRINFIT